MNLQRQCHVYRKCHGDSLSSYAPWTLLNTAVIKPPFRWKLNFQTFKQQTNKQTNQQTNRQTKPLQNQCQNTKWQTTDLWPLTHAPVEGPKRCWGNYRWWPTLPRCAGGPVGWPSSPSGAPTWKTGWRHWDPPAFLLQLQTVQPTFKMTGP